MTGKKFRPYNTDNVTLNAASVDETKGTPISFHDCRQIDWLVKTSAGVATGVVELESADASDYSGNWNNIDSIDVATIGAGAEYGNSFPCPPGSWVRARISTVIGGGTVTVYLNGLLQ